MRFSFSGHWPLTKRDTSGKTDQVRGEQVVEGEQQYKSSHMPVLLEVCSTKKTSAMTKLHEASSEHAGLYQ